MVSCQAFRWIKIAWNGPRAACLLSMMLLHSLPAAVAHFAALRLDQIECNSFLHIYHVPAPPAVLISLLRSWPTHSTKGRVFNTYHFGAVAPKILSANAITPVVNGAAFKLKFDQGRIFLLLKRKKPYYWKKKPTILWDTQLEVRVNDQRKWKR